MTHEETLRRMTGGQLYTCNDEELAAEQLAALDRLFAYNALPPSKQAEKQALLREMFAEIGEGCYIETPFHANWGGKYVHFGDHIYANFNLTLVDDCPIYVGSYTMFGPNVTVATAGHPIDPDLRRRVAQFNLPIHIGENVWIGAGAIIMPGITIGDNSVIGAGSVVTRDIPANVVAVGSPCRVLREISDRDREFYHKNRKIDL
ncbi:MAG: sugar O-acetyltransferase [Clostridia bacterium]|nr:sugar O-acetyltransferase [Clostridia bacterium]